MSLLLQEDEVEEMQEDEKEELEVVEAPGKSRKREADRGPNKGAMAKQQQELRLKAMEDNNNEMATLLSTTRNRPPEIEHPLNQVERTCFHEIEIIDPKFFENLSIRQMKNFVNQVRLDGKKVDERFSRTYKLS